MNQHGNDAALLMLAILKNHVDSLVSSNNEQKQNMGSTASNMRKDRDESLGDQQRKTNPISDMLSVVHSRRLGDSGREFLVRAETPHRTFDVAVGFRNYNNEGHHVVIQKATELLARDRVLTKLLFGEQPVLVRVDTDKDFDGMRKTLRVHNEVVQFNVAERVAPTVVRKLLEWGCRIVHTLPLASEGRVVLSVQTEEFGELKH